MQQKLSSTLNSISYELENSSIAFEKLANFANLLDRDFFLIESVFEDSTVTLSRVITDDWKCEIEIQIEKNTNWKLIMKKLGNLIEEDLDKNQLLTSFAPIAKLNASILDNKGRDESGRPIPGILCKPLSKTLQDLLFEIDFENSTPKSWSDWFIKFEKNIEIINEIVKHFPQSHNFGSIPWSLSVMCDRILKLIKEQINYSRTLEILTRDDSRGKLFSLDVLLLEQKLLPIPMLSEEEE